MTDWTSREIILDSTSTDVHKITDASGALSTLNIHEHFGNGPYSPPTAVLVDSFIDALNRTYTFSYDTTQVKPPVTGVTNSGTDGQQKRFL